MKPAVSPRSRVAPRPEAIPSLFDLADGQREALKWIALVSMLIDHIGRYGLGLNTQSWAFAAGRLAFPIFAFVLATNLAREGDRIGRLRRTMFRLGFWCGVSVMPSWWARAEFLPVNVFATLALGAVLCWVVETWGASGAMRRLGTGLVALATCLAACFVEFSVPGVGLIPTLYAWRRTGRAGVAGICAALLILIGLMNAAFGGATAGWITLGAVGVAAGVQCLPVQMPRLKLLFYAIYPIHLTLLGACCT